MDLQTPALKCFTRYSMEYDNKILLSVKSEQFLTVQIFTSQQKFRQKIRNQYIDVCTISHELVGRFQPDLLGYNIGT